MHAATRTTAPLVQCSFRGQPSVVESSSPFVGASSFYFCQYYPTTPCTDVFRVSRLCVPCVTRGVLSKFVFVGSPRFCAGEAFFAVGATTKNMH